MATKVIRTSVSVFGLSTTFAAETDIPSPFRYWWMKNGTLIPGAASAKTYATPPLASVPGPVDKFSVRVFGVNDRNQTIDELSNEVGLVDEPKQEEAHAVVDLEPGRIPEA